MARAVAAGTAVVAVEPQARWERLYRIVDHIFEHHGDRADPLYDSSTDLFGLAQSIADRTHGMVSIEDEASHVLAYSASSDEADELRRLSILGRAGPREHLQWLGQWGIFDALRARPEVVRVDERPELGLQPRLAIGIHQPTADRRRAPAFAGTIWVQQGSRPLADDAEEVLRGAAVLAARIMARLAATPSTHAVRVQQLVGLRDGAAGEGTDPGAIARELGIAADARAALIGVESVTPHPRLADVLALSASAFHPDALVTANGPRVHILFPVDRQAHRSDIVGARRRRLVAHRVGPGAAGGGGRPGGRAGAGRDGARRGGPRARQRRPPPRHAASGDVAGRGAHHRAARRDRHLDGRRRPARRPAGA